jgi:hypothetical protein
MTPSDAHASSTSHRVLDDLVGITENLTSGADPAALLRELLLATGMTLKNPSGIVAANTRLARGSAGAFRAAVDRAMGRDNPGPIAIAVATNDSPIPLIKRTRRTSCWLSSICCSASLLPNSLTPPARAEREKSRHASPPDF